MDNSDTWFHTFDEQPLPEGLDANLTLSPNTLDALCREYIEQPDTKTANEPQASQAPSAEQRRLTILEDKVQSMESTMRDMQKYIEALELWTKEVSEALEKLGEVPPSATRSEFEEN